MKKIRTTEYDIFVTDISLIDEFIKNLKYSTLFVLVDENTKKWCWPKLKNLSSFKKATIIEIPSGEDQKNLETCKKIWKLLETGDRYSLLINLGGGVITDIGGFTASTFKRGIKFINIPTTLLSQVDASVGGKVGINFEGLKNEIGLFSNPKAVFIDTYFLETLDERNIKSGFAEIIKHALICDYSYWNEIQRESTNIEKMIRRSIEIKSDIVHLDPDEKHDRKSLNFGHTIGHAIESISHKSESPLLHGEAIAIGMICETYISNKICSLNRNYMTEIIIYIINKFSGLIIKEEDIPSTEDNSSNDPDTKSATDK